MIDERIAEGRDDLAWAKPLVDAALAGVARGEVISHAEHEARMAALIATMRG